MAEIFSTTLESIKLSLQAIDYAKAVWSAPRAIQLLSEQVKASDPTLRQVWNYYIIHISDNSDERLKEYFSLVRDNVERYSVVLQGLQKYIHAHRDSWSTLKSRARYLVWPRVQKRLRVELSQAQQFHKIFQGMIAVLSAKDTSILRADSKLLEFSLQQSNVVLKAYKSEAEVRLWIDELPSGPFDINEEIAKHRRRFYQSAPEWIIKHDAFKKRYSELTNDRWLWGIGSAGTGKTCIASFLAEMLAELGPTTTTCTPQNQTDAQCVTPIKPDTGVAMFYCSYKSNDAQDPKLVIRCCRRIAYLGQGCLNIGLRVEQWRPLLHTCWDWQQA